MELIHKSFGERIYQVNGRKYSVQEYRTLNRVNFFVAMLLDNGDRLEILATEDALDYKHALRMALNSYYKDQDWEVVG